jgi:GNAT superfamily N-acetyltransferase
VLQRVIDLLPVPIAASYLCPHLPGASLARYDLDCPNRKPRPGFILRALQAYDAHPDDCLFVGDSITDLEAAQAAGVPFCWADRFFSRPIDRGMQTRDKKWIGLREEPGAISGGMRLLAYERGEEIGWLTLSPQRTSGGDCAAVVDLCVDEGHDRQEIGSLLLAVALEWAREQGLERLDLSRSAVPQV